MFVKLRTVTANGFHVEQGRFLREIIAKGRIEVICSTCRDLFWPTPEELERWTACPHCKGWGW